jgi:hypothetical protein
MQLVYDAGFHRSMPSGRLSRRNRLGRRGGRPGLGLSVWCRGGGRWRRVRGRLLGLVGRRSFGRSQAKTACRPGMGAGRNQQRRSQHNLNVMTKNQAEYPGHDRIPLLITALMLIRVRFRPASSDQENGFRSVFYEPGHEAVISR